LAARPVFYFDLGSPYAYLAAERLERLIPTARWQPILLGGLFKLEGRGSWGTGSGRAAGMVEVERRAAAYGLAPVRWPHPWPGNMLTAMRAATFAARQGLEVAFALAAFRRAFAAGEDLGRPEPVLGAAADAGLDPARVRAATGDQGVKDSLRRATEDAHARGVKGVPTLAASDRLYWGDDRLEAAAGSVAGPAAGAGYS
jgi:2-hydroxychromene-2-carboxylate isomerase